MTSVTNKNIKEHTYTGDTLDDMWEEFKSEREQGKVDETKVLRVDVDWTDEYGWTMHVYVSTYANTK